MPNDSNTASRYSRLKRSARGAFNNFQERHKRVKLAEINSSTNSWDSVPDGVLSFSTLIKNYIKMRLLSIFPDLMSKKGQEREALMELSRILFGVENVTNNKQSGKKAVNGWMAVMNVLAWPYAVLKFAVVSFNSIVDTLDLIVSLFVLKSIKGLVKLIDGVRVSPLYSQDVKYTDKIQDLIDDIKKTGSLPARAIKRLVNFAEIIPETLLSLPIDAAREIDAWLDERAESVAKNTASNSDLANTAPAAIVPVAEPEEVPAGPSDSASPVATDNDSKEVKEVIEETHQEKGAQEDTQVETQTSPVKLSLCDQQEVVQEVQPECADKTNSSAIKGTGKSLGQGVRFFDTAQQQSVKAPDNNHHDELHRPPTPIAP